MGCPVRLLAPRPPRFDDASSLLAEIGVLVQGFCEHTLEELEVGEREGGAHLAVRLHPAARWVRFEAGPVGPLRVEADGAYVGPGHLVHVGALLQELGSALALAWESPVADALRILSPEGAREATLRWLESEASARLSAEGNGWTRPLLRDRGHRFAIGERLATPLGPRDRDWLEAVARDPAQGLEALPWLEEAGDAAERLGRALARMWTEVRYRPLLSEMEEELVDSICEDLEEAYALDPTLSYPTAAWKELYALLDGSRMAPAFLATAGSGDEEPIGYRRGNVHLTRGAFELTVPGALAEEEREAGLWLGDRDRELWFEVFSLDPEEVRDLSPESLLDGLPDEEGEALPLERGVDGVARRMVVALGGADGHFVHGAAALPGRIAMLAIRVADPRAVEWALGVVRSLRAASDGEPTDG